jgi:hypothetical protein
MDAQLGVSGAFQGLTLSKKARYCACKRSQTDDGFVFSRIVAIMVREAILSLMRVASGLVRMLMTECL